MNKTIKITLPSVMSKSMNNVAKTMDCTDIEFTKHAISLLTRLQEYKNKHPESRLGYVDEEGELITEVTLF